MKLSINFASWGVLESLQDYHYGGHKDFQIDASWAEKLTKTRVPFQKAPTVSFRSICSWYYPYWPFWMHNWRICRNVMFNLIHRKYYSRWMSVIWYYYYLKIDTDSTSNIQKKSILSIFCKYSVHFVRPQVVKITWSLGRWWWRVARPRGASWLPPACSWADRWKCQVAEYPGKVPTAHPASRHPHQGWDHHINIVSSLGP